MAWIRGICAMDLGHPARDVSTYTEDVTNEMILLRGADDVVRKILPTALEVAGLEDAGLRLRDLPALDGQQAIERAVSVLKSIRHTGDEGRKKMVEEACFWCSAACEAASRDDAAGFSVCLRAAIRAIQAELPGMYLH